MKRNFVGVAIDPAGLDGQPDDLVGLELEGFREVDLGDAKVTLMLLRWAPDESAEATFFRALINPMDEEEENSD